MNQKISNPSLLLLIILVAFPQISETIYTPSLPDIALSLGASNNMIQLTLSIYFVGFAVGVFCWGRFSDFIGRRPAMLWGILVYGIGSFFCYLSNSVEWLLICRFIQAFGASAGSVITQTILRESIEGAKRHAVFAQISAALAFTPAIGPLLGGWIDQLLGFRAVFFTLVLMSIVILMYTWTALPETKVTARVKIDILSIAKRLITDRRVLGFGFLIGATNGILFSYYAEAPFIFIDFFQMEPGWFGFFGIFVALSSIVGAMLSKKLILNLRPEKIIVYGSIISMIGAITLLCFAIIGIKVSTIDLLIMVVCIFIILLGIGMSIPNCLSLALVNYGDVLGTAGAIFGLGYYIIVSLITTGMSLLHNESLLRMPMYFLCLTVAMVLVSHRLVKYESR